MRCDIVLCGVGGQGTVLASKLLADAAICKGLPVKTAETIGMAQRGGSVFSHVRLGEGSFAPLIGKGRADVLIAFEPAEAVRQMSFLKPGGTVVVSNRAIVPVTSTIGGPQYDEQKIMSYLQGHAGRLVTIDADTAFRELGSSKCLNVVLLGAAVRTGDLCLNEEDLKVSISRLVPERFLELNLRALAYSRDSKA